MAIKKSQLYRSIWQGCDELRGGMDASQYKDYVLVLLFVRYVSDKYADQKNALVVIPEGGSFADLVKLKGKPNIGEGINVVLNTLAEPICPVTKQVKDPSLSASYPAAINSKARQALYDNLGKDQTKALAVDEAVMDSREDNWRGHLQKERKIKIAISKALPESSDGLKDLFEIIKNQHEY